LFSLITGGFFTMKFVRPFGWPQNSAFRMLNFQLLVRLLLVASAVALTAIGEAAEAPLAAKLQGRLTATWEGQELQTVLERIADSQHVSLWVDRRVDPQHIVNAQFTDADLSQVLERILDDANLGWSAWEEIIYIGPKESAREAATLLAIARGSLDELSASRRARWLAAEAASWPRLSDPRTVLAGWLEQAGVTVKHSEALSHDLWDGRKLPPLPLVDRVVLLLLGFDKTCRISASGQTLEIVPITRPVSITEEYAPGRQMRELLSAFREDASVVLNRQGNRVAVTGRWEDQQRARQIIKGAGANRNATTARPGRNQERRFSLKLENQRVDKVIEQLTGQLRLEVIWQADAQSRRETLTSCDVRNGTLEELLTGVLSPAGLSFTLSEKQLTIRSGE
jgi:hypothetical protein